MEYLIRFVQVHETFRRAEIESLAILAHVNVEIVNYDEYSPFCVVRLQDDASARALIHRSILSKGIYELWGSNSGYEDLFVTIRQRTETQWSSYEASSFRFEVDTYQGKRSTSEQRSIIESFSFLGFNGPIRMQGAEEQFCIFEHYDFGADTPKQLHMGRWIADGARASLNTYSLKKRKYISTTSMDSELALVTANLTLAGPGKLFYDPFVGTGSFPIACSHFGAVSLGSDIDGRSVRGKHDQNIVTNFQQYELIDKYLGSFISDLTHSPLRCDKLFDGIICDPPYGVREGLKVLGNRDGDKKEAIYIDGVAAHMREGYIPPKRPYSFEAMLDDILDFAALSLVKNGRLSLWMPTANDEEVVLEIPTHPCLEQVDVCVQAFNKWSRRLLVYRRVSGVPTISLSDSKAKLAANGQSADDLNSFRKRYFQGFKASDSNGSQKDIEIGDTFLPT